jgi:2-keto-4-pentenoate hydratase/2-oxohepta-3-ene-1,7-dioic acid hydratase in catechol pathway
MKLVTFRMHTENRLGCLVDQNVVDLTSAYALYLREVEGVDEPYLEALQHIPPCMTGFLRLGEKSREATSKTLEFVKNKDVESKAPNGERILFRLGEVVLRAPVPRPGKIYALALNYQSHAKEEGVLPFPEGNQLVPIVFYKPASSVIGPGDPIVIPRISEKVDHEVELAVVIGRKGKNISRHDAYEFVGGYTVFNDVSFRDLGFPNISYYAWDFNWTKTKGLDNAAPMGPCLVLRDEIPVPYPLRLTLRVNGTTRQEGSTDEMAIRIPEIIEYLSMGTTLEPGDIISTGTPGGVGLFSGRFLRPNDIVEAEVERIGILRNPVIAERAGTSEEE